MKKYTITAKNGASAEFTDHDIMEAAADRMTQERKERGITITRLITERGVYFYAPCVSDRSILNYYEFRQRLRNERAA